MIRKSWGGNATWKGARIQECVMSVCRTGRLQGVDVIGALTELQRQPHLGLLPGLLLPDRTSVIPDAMAEFVDKHLRAR